MAVRLGDFAIQTCHFQDFGNFSRVEADAKVFDSIVEN